MENGLFMGQLEQSSPLGHQFTSYVWVMHAINDLDNIQYIFNKLGHN